MKILGTNRDSKCMYCDSTSYGRACIYGPQGRHVHSDDPKRCVWCGSTNSGRGCAHNPFGKMHQKGIAFNPIMAESVETGIIQGILMKRLSESISDTPAYKAGLVDEAGNVIKEPVTIEEKRLLTNVDRYMIKIRNLVKEKIDLINTTLYYEKYEEESVEELGRTYEAELAFKDELQECVSNLFGIIEEYNCKGLSSSKIEKLLIEAIVNEKNV